MIVIISQHYVVTRFLYRKMGTKRVLPKENKGKEAQAMEDY